MNSDHNRQPTRRVIVLGASNVTRGLRSFCETAARLWGQPLDVLAAIGYGRSYGQTSRVLARTLPGIRGCEMWEEWRARPPLPTAALMTDIGNDILYGAAPVQISKWVRECGERLAEQCETVVISALPMCTVNSLGPRRFKIMRSILFPSSRLTWQHVVENARELDERVAEIAKKLNFGRTEPDARWYGFDPIHVRRRYRHDAWDQLLRPWRETTAESHSRSNASHPTWQLTRLQPKHQWYFGIKQYRPQPAWTGADGSRLSLY